MKERGPDITAADIAGFLEKGHLDNLVALFRSDPALYPHIAPLLEDERIVIRLGAAALVETLAEEDPGHALDAARTLIPLLEAGNPLFRGDAAYLLGVVGSEEALPALERLTEDENGDVREAAAEAAERIRGR